ncbi:hypothetical protein [Streptodolium elevatio]
MGVQSENPLTVDQVFAALVAVRAAPVVDPELRPDGPIAEDVPELLGALLAKVELEAAALVPPGDTEVVPQMPGLVRGWSEQVGGMDAATVVLAHRLQRTARDLDAAVGGTLLPSDPGHDLGNNDDQDHEDQEHGEDDQDDEDVPPVPALNGAVNAALAALAFLEADAHDDDPEQLRAALDGCEGMLAMALLQLHARRMQLNYRGA